MSIDLTIPLEIIKDATKAKVDWFKWEENKIVVSVRYTDVDGTIIKQDIIHLKGNDYDAVMNDTVAANDVGKAPIALVRKKIQNRVKNILNLVGTET